MTGRKRHPRGPKLPSAPAWDHPGLALYDGLLLHRNAPIEMVAVRGRNALNYLATPYSKRAVDEAGRWCERGSRAAWIEAEVWAAAFAERGVSAVSPIAQACGLIHIGQGRVDPLDHRFWTGWCAPLLAASGAVIVPPIEGWAESLGVWQEVREMLYRMRPVYLIEEGADP